MKISSLNPTPVWAQFEEICKVPRPSKKEGKMIDFMVAFAKKHKLDFEVDKTGNVIIRKPATKGCEGKPMVALQAHMDMVCEKNASKKHDFEKDPIVPVIDGEWVRADGTTLGADDGIGVAMAMAILAAKDIEHGPLECLFTIDEETGLTGAFGLETGKLKSKILLNLDSEDDGQIFIGCAGGMDTVGTLKYKTQPTTKEMFAFKVSVSGLKGGHSGDDIDKGRGNSNKLLNRFISDYSKKHRMGLSDFNGGNLRNAIPREAYAVVLIPVGDAKKFEKAAKDYDATIKHELSVTDAGVTFSYELVERPRRMLAEEDFQLFTRLIYSMPHGVLGMSFKLKGIVETSTNLASVKFAEGHKIIITTSQRSDADSLKVNTANMVENCLLLAGAKVVHSDGYPGWTPNPDSPILKIAMKVYKDLFNEDAIFRSIHAGLECGLFSTKYPDMDMISYGPTLRCVHSPDEKIEISTVDKFWKMTLEILRRV